MKGTYKWLTDSPLWLVFAELYFFCIGILHVGRWFFEGHAYNTAFISEHGDVAIIVCIIVGVTVLGRKPVITGLLGDGDFHITLALMCMIVGFISNLWLNTKEVMDLYHNILVLPLLAYLILVTVPIVFKYGTTLEKTAVVVLIAVWGLLGVVDISTGRLDQQKWVIEHYRRY